MNIVSVLFKVNYNRFVGLDATKPSLDGTYTVIGKSKSGCWLAY